eukprot:superscaffoldBa00001265_g9803
MWRKGSSDRFEYLQTLVTEFQDTDSEEAKEQVLANLANFAYDPKNMEYLRELQVTDLFLDMLTEENENFVEFGMEPGVLFVFFWAPKSYFWAESFRSRQKTTFDPSAQRQVGCTCTRVRLERKFFTALGVCL